jgi:glycosyltransferase involved in cell wall biosynthesis
MSIEDKFVILGVASKWSLESKSATKGLDILIQLSYELPKDMIIILVGELDKSVELPSNIINIPKTNKIEDLVKYYSLADVFLNPSKEETFGKVTAEALLCGTPAIVTNSTANPELVKNSNHILTNFENKNILKIIHIIKQNKIDLEISYYKEIFNKHKRIQEYIVLYNALLNK